MLSPNGREGAPALSATDRPPPQTQLTRRHVQSGQLGLRIHGENSGVALGESRRNAGSVWGHASREETSFSGPIAQGSFAAASLRAFDVCTCPCVHPPLPGRRFYPERFTAVPVYAAIDGWKSNGNPLQYSCLENPMDRGAW